MILDKPTISLQTDKWAEESEIVRKHGLVSISKLEDIEPAIHSILKDDEFKIPYQGKLMKEMYNISEGFNRTYFKDPMSYNYLPSATLNVEGASFKLLIKALIIKIKRIIRLRILKKR